jgi:hypothetical protein
MFLRNVGELQYYTASHPKDRYLHGSCDYNIGRNYLENLSVNEDNIKTDIKETV